MDPAGLWPQQGTRRERLPAQITRKHLKTSIARRKAPSKPASPASNPPAAAIGHRKKHTQLYLDVANGLHSTHQPARSRLFSQASNASTAALRSKLCPSLITTNDWTRVQRKLLPKYMFVLDAVTAVQLLQCLARLQPPVVKAASNGSSWKDTGTSSAADLVQQLSGIPAQQEEHQPAAVAGVERPLPPPAQQQHQQHAARQHFNQLQAQLAICPSLDQLAGLRSSNYVSLAGPVPGLWPAAPANSTQLSAAHASAISRGFPDVATAREEFDLMLTAVYTVLAPKMAQWPFAVQLQLLCCAGHLQLCHPNFVQAWCAASVAHLPQQSASDLLRCMEALSRLMAEPPSLWQHAWQQAMRPQLQDLSLPHLAALQLHLVHCRSTPLSAWWQQFHAAVLSKVEGGTPRQEPLAPGGTTFANSSSTQQMQQLPAQSVPVNAGKGLDIHDTDALCALLCTSHMAGHTSEDQWVHAALQRCFEACQQGNLSSAGVLQLLAACCFGCCRSQADVAVVQAACLRLLQDRMAKLPSPEGLAVFFACIISGAMQVQAPAGFAAAFDQRLTELLPGVDTGLLLHVPLVVSAINVQTGPSQRLVAAFALVTHTRLPEMQWDSIQLMLYCCMKSNWNMPTIWVASVVHRLDELALEAGLDNRGLLHRSTLSCKELWGDMQQLRLQLHLNGRQLFNTGTGL